MIHTCEGCGLMHDSPGAAAEASDVAIARIQAESAVRIAELQARADRHIADAEAGAAVAVAREEADAVQEALADEEADEHVADAIGAAAAGLAGIGDTPDPSPMPIVQAVDVGGDDEQPEPRELSEPPAPPAKRGLGMW